MTSRTMQWWLFGSGSALALLSAGALAGACVAADPPDGPVEVDEPVGKVQQAATGVCDSNPPFTTQACIDAIQQNGGVVNDIFTDSNGLPGPSLPVFGQLFNNWPGCTTANAGCNCGESLAPFDCPGQYTCSGPSGGKSPTVANVATCVNALDRLWGHPHRLTDHNLIGPCPNWASTTPDGQGGNYFPWEGLVFDLGGPSNQVAIFAENDHGPQPCESLEYTVYLTDNPYSQERIQDPAGTGVDPSKWNRAVLTKIFTKGWVEVRPPDPGGHASCGDTQQYSVEEDSFAQVFSLPCGINFRYTAIIAGNDGLDFPECAFDSSEAELDAVAGLTEGGAGVCPDADDDLYVDCNCPGAPPVCDCDDTDAAINPSAPEPCDSPDVNCDGNPGGCASPLVCYGSICVPTCADETASCPDGSSCQQTQQGPVCVPDDCTSGGCPPGSVCEGGQCVPACTDVVCPGQMVCRNGACIDPCKDITCPAPMVCQNATCVAPCSCFQGDAGCADLPGTVCDKGNTDLCVTPQCLGVVCDPGQTCDPATGTCLDFCHPGVKCPKGQKCVDQVGCMELCYEVTCQPGYECNPETGECQDAACKNVTCIPPAHCVGGQCVGGEGGAGGSSSSGTGGGGVGGGSSSSGAPAVEPGDEGACGCRLLGAQPSKRGPGAAWLLMLAAALLVRRRTPPRRLG